MGNSYRNVKYDVRQRSGINSITPYIITTYSRRIFRVKSQSEITKCSAQINRFPIIHSI